MMFREGELQRTLAAEIIYSGVALHTGIEVNIRCLPAETDRGIVFKRVDLPGEPEIKAAPYNVFSTKRCTSIGLGKKGTPGIHTVEHMMAAFWAMGIDNVVVEIDNEETPVADGSSLPYIQLIRETGIKTLEQPRRIYRVEQPIWVRKQHMYMMILPYNGFKVSYTLDYDHPGIGTQFLEFDIEEDSFSKEIAPARTFGFAREVEALHRHGLALGGSLENAVLIGEEKPVNSLRFKDEFVRHKILDVIGDMALNGYIFGHIIAVKSGHSLHVELAAKIRNSQEEKLIEV